MQVAQALAQQQAGQAGPQQPPRPASSNHGQRLRPDGLLQGALGSGGRVVGVQVGVAAGH